MEYAYLERSELARLFQVAYNANGIQHLAFVTALWHGLRVSELNQLRGTNVHDGQIEIRRLKGSNASLQDIHYDPDDPLFDESPIIELARMRGTNRLFPWSRQYFDRLIKAYGVRAGLHPGKAHMHSLKHSLAMMIWDESKSLGEIQNYLGHVAASSTLAYLKVLDGRKGQGTVSRIKVRPVVAV